MTRIGIETAILVAVIWDSMEDTVIKDSLEVDGIMEGGWGEEEALDKGHVVWVVGEVQQA